MARADEATYYPIVVADPHYPGCVFARGPEIDFPT